MFIKRDINIDTMKSGLNVVFQFDVFIFSSHFNVVVTTVKLGSYYTGQWSKRPHSYLEHERLATDAYSTHGRSEHF